MFLYVIIIIYTFIPVVALNFTNKRIRVNNLISFA